MLGNKREVSECGNILTVDSTLWKMFEKSCICPGCFPMGRRRSRWDLMILDGFWNASVDGMQFKIVLRTVYFFVRLYCVCALCTCSSLFMQPGAAGQSLVQIIWEAVKARKNYRCARDIFSDHAEIKIWFPSVTPCTVKIDILWLTRRRYEALLIATAESRARRSALGGSN